jgi:hypothetical protein
MKEHADQADRATRALSTHRLDGRKQGWGWPYAEELATQRQVSDVAALVGWDDPRTKKRVDGLVAANVALQAERRRLFGDLHAAAKADLVVHDLDAHLEETACGARKAALGLRAIKSPCVARITLRNDGTLPLALTPYSGPSAYVATAATGPVDARFEGITKTELAPKESVEVIVVPKATSIDAEPAIIRICVTGTCDVLRAR